MPAMLRAGEPCHLLVLCSWPPSPPGLHMSTLAPPHGYTSRIQLLNQPVVTFPVPGSDLHGEIPQALGLPPGDLAVVSGVEELDVDGDVGGF